MRISAVGNGWRSWRWALVLLGPAFAALGLVPCFAQQMHRNNFESNRTYWIKGAADAAFDELAHAMSDTVAHEGVRSEYIHVSAKQGSQIVYYYPTASAPISDDLTVTVWVKANRPGIQLSARVVLPKEANPASLEDRLTTVIIGDTYRKVGLWQALQIPRAVKLATEQQQRMQAQLGGRPVNFQGAYIDRLMLNVYGGSGDTEVWIDELEIGPVVEGAAPKDFVAPPKAGDGGASKPPPTAGKLVDFNGSHLQIDGKRFFFHGIRYTDTPVRALREAGFNTLFVEFPWDPAVLKQAVDQGFWLVPNLPVTSDDARFVSTDGLTRELRTFPEQDAVLFWNLGTALASEQATLVGRTSQLIQQVDRQHAIGVDAWDGLGRYSGSVNLVGIHRWPLGTTLQLTQYKEWLEMRIRLANPGTFLWTWVQTHTPELYTQVLYNKPATGPFTEPIGPQPEQVRLLTYLAVGSGFRGVAFWSDRFLADTHQGRDRLLTVALLNQELEFLEPLLNTADGSPQWIDTSDPNVKAAVLRTARGILVLPMWLGDNAQFVPGQAAVAKLKFTVPLVPPSFQCWEVAPGEVKALKVEKGKVGGMEVVLPEFGLTSAIVFTSDIALIQHFQELCWARRQLAAQYTYDLAVKELEKVARVEEELEKSGHTLPDGQALMKDAYDRLKAAKALWENHQYGAAYQEAQRALRPARIMMRAQWDKALRGLETPVSSPYAVSFYTLPRHWEFMDQINASSPGANLLTAGDFEVVPGRPVEQWYTQQSTLDEVDLRAERVAEIAVKPPKNAKAGAQTTLTAKEGRQFLVLEIKPKSKTVPVSGLERTYLAVSSPTVKLAPGTLVRVSGWMAVPESIQLSPDGALLYDSAGGEPLAVRLAAATRAKDTEPIEWRHFTLYRRVPASGMMNVTLALTGIGRVAFDDIRIEPMGAPAAARPAP